MQIKKDKLTGDLLGVGRIFGFKAYDRSWHPTAVLGVLGVAAGASYLLRLDAAQTANALGIAASEASGIKKNFGAMMKSVHAGSAARKGLWAAQMARRGLAADAAALDGKFGFFELYQPNGADPSLLTAELGAAYRGEGLSFKPYPCGRPLHAAIDAVGRHRHHRGHGGLGFQKGELLQGGHRVCSPLASAYASPVTD